MNSLLRVLLVILLTCASQVDVCSQTISNIRTYSDNQMVMVEYDLINSGAKPVDIILKVELNNSKVIYPQLVIGDLYSVKSGKNKRIQWRALEEIGQIEAELVVSLSCETSNFNQVRIGSQIWMVENLRVSKFRNGDVIFHAQTPEEWKNACKDGKPAWCYYNNELSNGLKYGKLYNWYAITDSRNLAPEGWHIPNDEQWNELKKYLGPESVVGSKMKSNNAWEGKGIGSNSSGFSAYPGGRRNENGTFDFIGDYGYWWSATEYNRAENGYMMLGSFNDYLHRGISSKCAGFSVRCLRD